MFCHNVHGDLAKVKICADPCCCRDSRSLQNVTDHLHGKLPGGKSIAFQVMSGINKDLVNGIDMDILHCNIFQINIYNPGAVFHIKCHPGRSGNITDLQLRITFQILCHIGRSGKFTSRSKLFSSGIDFLHLLYHLKKSRAARDAIGLHGWRYSQTDGFFRTAGVCHHKICFHGIQSSLPAFHGSIKGLQINSYIYMIFANVTHHLFSAENVQ